MAVMLFRKIKPALLILALLMGQALTLAHAFQHPALSAVDQTCQLCLHAPGLDAAAPPPASTLAIAVAQTAMLPQPAQHVRASFPAIAPPIRGPPSILA